MTQRSIVEKEKVRMRLGEEGVEEYEFRDQDIIITAIVHLPQPNSADQRLKHTPSSVPREGEAGLPTRRPQKASSTSQKDQWTTTEMEF